MKKAPGFIEFVGSQPNQQWSRGVVMVLAAATLFVGCGKKAEQPAAVSQPTNASADAQPAPATPAPAAPQQAATPSPAAAEPDLAALNRAIRRWLVANRRVPKNFDEFAATAGVSIPPPPSGKKYILTKDMHIQLADVK